MLFIVPVVSASYIFVSSLRVPVRVPSRQPHFTPRVTRRTMALRRLTRVAFDALRPITARGASIAAARARGPAIATPTVGSRAASTTSSTSDGAADDGAAEDAAARADDDVAARLSNAAPPSTSERDVRAAPARLTRDRLYYPGQTYAPSDLAPKTGRSAPVVHTSAGKTVKNPMRGKVVEATLIEKATYTDARFLTQFVSDTGKLYPKRRLGVSAKAQRAISRATKTARQMGILPYTERLPQFRKARNPDV